MSEIKMRVRHQHLVSIPGDDFLHPGRMCLRFLCLRFHHHPHRRYALEKLCYIRRRRPQMSLAERLCFQSEICSGGSIGTPKSTTTVSRSRLGRSSGR